MPSKLLVAAAERAHDVRTASPFGLRTSLEVDGAAVMQRVRAWRDRFVAAVLERLDDFPEELRIEGRARFVGPRALQVGAHTRVDFETAIVATGTRPRMPRELEPVRQLVLTTDTVFELEALPRSLAVIGSGAVALELGQALQRLGVRLGLFAPTHRLGPLTDPEVARAAREVLGTELELHLGAEELAYEPAAQGLRVRWCEAGEARECEFERALVAAGRETTFGELDLAAAGIELDADGRPPFDPRTMRIGGSRLFLAGDAAGDRPLLHEASDEGRIAAANAASFPEVREHCRRTPLQIVFTDPQIAIAGASWSELEQRGGCTPGEASFADQGRAQVLGRAQGLARIYADAKGRLIGAELFGPRMEHAAHLLAWSIQAGLDVRDALAMPVYHPVLEEGIRGALRDLARRLGLPDEECSKGLDCGPGS
jgi:dihydrolipoamide dehydrogenase